MAATNPIVAQIVKDALNRFPTTPTKTLARKLYAENPEVWSSVESCRARIRYYRGKTGSIHRKKLKDKRFMNQKYSLPEPEVEDYEPYKLTGKRIGIISDLQIPFHDPDAVNAAVKNLKDKEIDTLVMNGDIFDFYQRSNFIRDPRKRDLKQEIEDAKNFVGWIRQEFPKTRLVFKEGNHEERWERWLMVKAPELLDMSEFRLDIILQAATHGIEWVKDKKPILAGNLTILHGHEHPQVGTINPSRNLYMKTGGDILIGHVHKTSEFINRKPNGDKIKTYTVGCLCGLTPKWFPINQWNHGWSIVEVTKNGDFEVSNKKM